MFVLLPLCWDLKTCYVNLGSLLDIHFYMNGEHGFLCAVHLLLYWYDWIWKFLIVLLDLVSSYRSPIISNVPDYTRIRLPSTSKVFFCQNWIFVKRFTHNSFVNFFFYIIYIFKSTCNYQIESLWKGLLIIHL